MAWMGHGLQILLISLNSLGENGSWNFWAYYELWVRRAQGAQLELWENYQLCVSYKPDEVLVGKGSVALRVTARVEAGRSGMVCVEVMRVEACRGAVRRFAVLRAVTCSVNPWVDWMRCVGVVLLIERSAEEVTSVGEMV